MTMLARVATWLHEMSFRGRLLVLLLVIAALQVVASGMTFRELQSAPVQQRAERQLADAVDTTLVGHLDASMQHARERLQLLATDPALQRAIIARDAEVVDGLLGAAGDAAAHVSVSGPDGEQLAGEQAGKDAIGVEAASLPLRRDGRLVGTLQAQVALDGDFLEQAGRLTPTLPFVIDGDSLRTVRGSDDMPAGEEPKEGFHTIEIDGAEQLAYLARVPGAEDGWLGAAIPTAKIAEERSAGRTSLVLFLVVLVVLMALVSILVTNAIGQAVGAFGRIASRLAAGDLDERIPVTGHDEMARVSIAFNDMADQLQHRIASLEDTQERLQRQLQLFGDVLGQSGDLDDVLETVCRAALDTTSATRARFWASDAHGRWHLAACIGLRAGDEQPLPLEAQAIERGHAVAVGEAPHWLAVPSGSAGEALGILTLVREDGQLTAEEVRSVEHLARQAAAAIDTARLRELEREHATRDGLTGLANHRHMQDVLLAQLNDAQSRSERLSVILFDVDNFKRVNDTYGHEAGDRALKAIAGVISEPVVPGSLSARYGGEEFVVTLPDVGEAQALEIAEGFRRAVEALVVPTREGTLRISSSFGVSHLGQFPAGTATPAVLLSTADEALYAAKHQGKNRVVLASPDAGSALRLVA